MKIKLYFKDKMAKYPSVVPPSIRVIIDDSSYTFSSMNERVKHEQDELLDFIRPYKPEIRTWEQLYNLKDLNLSSNELRSLPKSFGKLTNLEWLNLTGNKLEFLPKSFGNLIHLKTLYLHHNQLEGLPEAFGDLTKLEWLDLNNNKLEGLPESFGNLTNLEWLDLRDNKLKLPESFANLTNLNTLYLSNHLIKGIPYNVCNFLQNKELLPKELGALCLPSGSM